MTGPGHISDSQLFGHLWSTDSARRRFSDRGKLETQVEILAALAEAQATEGLIPVDAAKQISQIDPGAIDLGELAAATRSSGHSMAGLIELCKPLLHDQAGEYFYFGATVQDVTDTWTAIVMRDTLREIAVSLRALEGIMLELSEAHRESPMLGRTHAQPGSPISFAFKVLVWAWELRRHLERILQTLPRVAVVELAGAVGVGSFGVKSAAIQRRMAATLELHVPEIAWLTARDRVAEFVVLTSMATASLAKVGNEIKQLQRAEVAELRETNPEGTIGSITMPHKRNPERSEQLVTLARVTRSAAALALEGLVHEHERDGAAWKTEWYFLPETCMATSAALELAREVLSNLEVAPDRMRANLEATDGFVMSEAAMMGLAKELGKHRAHELIYRASMEALRTGQSFDHAVRAVAADTKSDAVDLHQLLDLDSVLQPVTEATDRSQAELVRLRNDDSEWLR